MLERLQELVGQRVKVGTVGGQQHTAFVIAVDEEVVVLAPQPGEEDRQTTLRIDAVESVQTLAAGAGRGMQGRF